MADYNLGKLPSAELDLVASHLEECSSCTSQLVQLESQVDGFMQQLRQPVPDDLVADDSEMGRLVEMAAALYDTSVDDMAKTIEEKGPVDKTDVREICDQILDPPQAEDELGRLGGYRVLAVLGTGGMGIVFKAEDTSLKRHVALKVMRPSIALTSNSAGKRFLIEAQATAAIQHDNVVTIHQVGEERGVPFLAMQLLEGESLADRLKREEALPTAETLRIGREISTGLAAAHAKGLTHRDIKPDNIWLEAGTGRVKILDFGLARANDGQADVTESGVILGTPSYLSPQQACGDPVDHRADLFSLGVVLYKMTTGKSPFSRSNLMATLNAVTFEEPAPPATLDETIPAALSDLIVKLMEKEPDQRCQTAEEVIEQIRQIESVTAEPEKSTSPPTPARAQSPGVSTTADGFCWADRTKTIIVMAAAAALLAAVVIYVQTDRGMLVIKAGPDFIVTADNQTVTIRNKKTKREFKVQVGNQKSLPSGEYLIRVEDNEGLKFATTEFKIVRGGDEDLVVSMLPLVPVVPNRIPRPISPLANTGSAFGDFGDFALTSRPAKIPGLKSFTLETRYHRGRRIFDYGFSPDGQLLWTAGYDATVRFWRSDNLEPVQVVYSNVHNTQYYPNNSGRSVAFSPHGQFFWTIGYDYTVRIWRSDTFERVQVFAPGNVGTNNSPQVAWSVDGKQMAYGKDKRVVVMDTETWKKTQEYHEDREVRVDQLGWSASGLLMARFDYSIFVWDVKQGRLLRRRNHVYNHAGAPHWDGESDRIVTTYDTWDVHTDRVKTPGIPAKNKYQYYSADRSVAATLDSKDPDNLRFVLYSTADGATLSEIPLPKKRPDALRLTLSPKGKYIAWNDYDKGEPHVQIFDVATGKEQTSIGAGMSGAKTRWRPNGKELAIISVDPGINKDGARIGWQLYLRIANIETGDIRKGRIIHGETVVYSNPVVRDGALSHWKVVWSSGGAGLFSFGSELRKWDMTTGQFKEEVPFFQPEYWGSWQDWSAPEDIIMGKDSQGSASLTYHLKTKQVTKRVEGLGGFNGTLDGGRKGVILGKDKQTLQIMDTLTGKTIRSVKLAQPIDVNFGVSPAADLIASWTGEEMKIFNVADGAISQTINGKKLLGDEFFNWSSNRAFTISFHPDSTRAVLICSPQPKPGYLPIRQHFLWDLDQKRLIRNLEKKDNSFPNLGMWLNSQRYMIASRGMMSFYDRDGNLLKEWKDDGLLFSGAAMSPDGSRLACLVGTDWAKIFDGNSRLIQIRDMKTGQVLSTHCVLPTPDGILAPPATGMALKERGTRCRTLQSPTTGGD